MTIKLFFKQLKNFLPWLGIVTLYYAIIIVAVFLFNYTAPSSLAAAHHLNPFNLLVRWDSWHYLNIILYGYKNELVFFPLYPGLVGLVALFLPLIFSGFLVSFLSLTTTLYFFNRLLTATTEKNQISKTLVLLLLFPTALFFSLIYTESLFLALTVAFFYYAQKRQWLTAAIIGFFASLTRSVGIFLWPIYLIYILIAFYPADYKKLAKEELTRRMASILKKKEFWYSLIIPTGLLLFCLYGYWQFGDFLAFINGQKVWSNIHSFVWPNQFLFNFLKIILRGPSIQGGLYNFYRIVIMEGGSFLLLVVSGIYWLIKKNWPYGALCLLNALLLSTMFPITSADRYIVVIFPIFIFLADITKKADWLFYGLLVLFSALFFVNIYFFSTGVWVS